MPSRNPQRILCNALAKIINKKTTNQKRFCMQVLKKCLFFGDSSVDSSMISVGQYDPLLFSD